MPLTLTNFWKDLDWDNWLYGAWVAASSGFATAGAASFALYMQDPKDYNPFQSRFWVAFGTIVFFTAGSSFFAFLKQNPAPKVISRTTTSVTSTGNGGVVTMEQTVEKSSPVSLVTVSTDKPKAEDK